MQSGWGKVRDNHNSSFTLLKRVLLLKNIFLCMCVGGCAHVNTSVYRGQKRVFDSPELELQLVLGAVYCKQSSGILLFTFKKYFIDVFGRYDK